MTTIPLYGPLPKSLISKGVIAVPCLLAYNQLRVFVPVWLSWSRTTSAEHHFLYHLPLHAQKTPRLSSCSPSHHESSIAHKPAILIVPCRCHESNFSA